MSHPSASHVIDRDGLDLLMSEIRNEGYQLVGPTLKDGAVHYGPVESVRDLPVGWQDVQEKGTYRLRKRDDDAVFGFAVGPSSLKEYLFPPTLRLWRGKIGEGGWEVEPKDDESYRYAFLGVRACEIQAVAVQDRVFLEGAYPDPHYKARREKALIVAVNCTEPAGTCFCVSMNSGPRATYGFDISLTEVLSGDEHYFTVQAGTERGQDLLRSIPHSVATEAQLAEADRGVEQAKARMGRSMETADIKELLYRNYEHPRWDDVASRCISCTNCTMVCPTCFCSTVEDGTSLDSQQAWRDRRWDSCFTLGHSHMHGGPARPSIKSRYRQWMIHKLASWIDQFGTSGCVGCGRCVTWCPVGIDITEEVAAIRSSTSGIEDERERGACDHQDSGGATGASCLLRGPRTGASRSAERMRLQPTLQRRGVPVPAV